jgi:hypothetical protein
MPPWQMLLQHWPGLLHIAPFGWHPLVHKPPLHEPLQHCSSILHCLPFGWHLPQMPALQIWLQHSNAPMQGTPSGEHIPPPQTPFWQRPEQHSF